MSRSTKNKALNWCWCKESVFDGYLENEITKILKYLPERWYIFKANRGSTVVLMLK